MKWQRHRGTYTERERDTYTDTHAEMVAAPCTAASGQGVSTHSPTWDSVHSSYTHTHTHTHTQSLTHALHSYWEGSFGTKGYITEPAPIREREKKKPSIVERAGQLIRFSVENSTRKFPSKPKWLTGGYSGNGADNGSIVCTANVQAGTELTLKKKNKSQTPCSFPHIPPQPPPLLLASPPNPFYFAAGQH